MLSSLEPRPLHQVAAPRDSGVLVRLASSAGRARLWAQGKLRARPRQLCRTQPGFFQGSCRQAGERAAAAATAASPRAIPAPLARRGRRRLLRDSARRSAERMGTAGTQRPLAAEGKKKGERTSGPRKFCAVGHLPGAGQATQRRSLKTLKVSWPSVPWLRGAGGAGGKGAGSDE